MFLISWRVASIILKGWNIDNNTHLRMVRTTSIIIFSFLEFIGGGCLSTFPKANDIQLSTKLDISCDDHQILKCFNKHTKELETIKITKKDLDHVMKKRSPGCLLWCLNKKILHPAQCHSYCQFSG